MLQPLINEPQLVVSQPIISHSITFFASRLRSRSDFEKQQLYRHSISTSCSWNLKQHTAKNPKFLAAFYRSCSSQPSFPNLSSVSSSPPLNLRLLRPISWQQQRNSKYRRNVECDFSQVSDLGDKWEFWPNSDIFVSITVARTCVVVNIAYRFQSRAFDFPMPGQVFVANSKKLRLLERHFTRLRFKQSGIYFCWAVKLATNFPERAFQIIAIISHLSVRH